MQAASNRDYLGDKDGFNIEMAYTKFLGKLNELLRKEETSCE